VILDEAFKFTAQRVFASASLVKVAGSLSWRFDFDRLGEDCFGI
jgi:hypothetical protein